MVLALAVLTKETTVLFVAGVALTYLLQHHGRKLIELLLIALTPFVVWQLVLLQWFGQFGI